MKVIDLLNKIANNEEVPKKIKIHDKVFTFDKTYKRYIDEYEWETLGESVAMDLCLNEELEILCISDEIIEEKPKKIEEIPFNNGMESFMDVYHELENYNYRINDLIRTVNYLLEKESDK